MCILRVTRALSTVSIAYRLEGADEWRSRYIDDSRQRYFTGRSGGLILKRLGGERISRKLSKPVIEARECETLRMDEPHGRNL